MRNLKYIWVWLTNPEFRHVAIAYNETQATMFQASQDWLAYRISDEVFDNLIRAYDNVNARFALLKKEHGL
ncbi:MAG TPA: hypothetical protein VIY48_21980 [Candidatus Paceibacterota bacterium]